MAEPKIELEQLIIQHGGKLVRKNKHKVFKFPNGQTLVLACTPQDNRSYANSLALAKTLLGINPIDRGTPKNRRNKKSGKSGTKYTLSPIQPYKVNIKELSSQLSELSSNSLQFNPLPKKPSKIKHPKPKPSKVQNKQMAIGEISIKYGTIG